MSIQTVIKEITLQTKRQTIGCFPFQRSITDITDRLSINLLSQHIIRNEIGLRCNIVDIVITCHIETGIQAQVVNTLHISQPFLVAEHPCGIHAGEEAPDHATELQSAGIITET